MSHPLPYRRYRDAWVRAVRNEPTLHATTQAVLEALVDHPEKHRGNSFVCRRDVLAAWLGISARSVQTHLTLSERDGWLIRCGRAGNGRPQVWHRSTPWDPARYWPNPCPRCGSREKPVLPTLLPTLLPTVRDPARPYVCPQPESTPGFEDLIASVMHLNLTEERLCLAA